jgi:hypothetical protein
MEDKQKPYVLLSFSNDLTRKEIVLDKNKKNMVRYLWWQWLKMQWTACF